MRVLILASVYLCTIACGSSGVIPTAPTPQPVIPTITGQWSGTYTVTNCTESGAAVGACANIQRVASLSFTPTQTGSNLGGTLNIGSLPVSVTGNVTSDNVVSLSGSADVSGLVFALTQWRAVMTGSQMAGTMAFTISTVSPSGLVTITSTTSLAR